MDQDASRTQIAHEIIDLSTEIWHLHSSRPLGASVESSAEGLAQRDARPEHLKLPFYVASEALRAPLPSADLAPQRRYRLTRMIAAFARHFGKSHMPPVGELETQASVYEEFMFATSLAYHSYDTPPESPAALILHDIYQHPFAYQKSHGAPLAYVWRDALFDTKAGVRRLPKGSLVRPVYQPSTREGPQHELKGLGLVALQNYRPLDVEFLRFTINTLPGKIYGAVLDSCIEQQPALLPYCRHVLRLAPALMALRINRLAQRGKIVRLAG